ncbi:MAG: DUF302 domain-containing protein [Reyranella sp.]|nr:DUF302 domain-containing protein [Reyranella sp.]
MSNYLFRDSSAVVVAVILTMGGASANAQGVQQAALPAAPTANAAGVIAVPSAYGMVETVERLQKDIAAKGVMFFGAVDQGGLAAVSGVPGIGPSVLLMFGNPPLGTQFLGGNQQSGLDWPVRILVYLEAPGKVMIAWTDFAWIARRHGITTLDPQFKMAGEVAASIASAAQKR